MGTYLPPFNPCGSDGSISTCSYNLEFIGPGLACLDVTASSNPEAFTAASNPNTTNLFSASIVPRPDLVLQMSVQTWDMKRSVYQAANCTVSRSYSVAMSHNTSSTINVVDSQPISAVLTQQGVDLSRSPGNGNISFSQDYIASIMTGGFPWTQKALGFPLRPTGHSFSFFCRISSGAPRSLRSKTTPIPGMRT